MNTGESSRASTSVEAGRALAASVASAWPQWVARVIASGVATLDDRPDPEVVAEVIRVTADAIAHDVGADLAALLALPLDEQRSTPLQVVRDAAKYVGAALDALGVLRPTRDQTQVSLLPDDHHDVGPASFADLGLDVQHAALAWTATRVAMSTDTTGSLRSPDESRSARAEKSLAADDKPTS